MKKIWLLCLIVFVLYTPLTIVHAEENTVSPIKVFIDGSQVLFDVDPIIEYDTTLVQFRPIFEKLRFDYWMGSEN